MSKQQEANRRLLNEGFDDFHMGQLRSGVGLDKYFTEDVVFEIDLPDRSNDSHIGGRYVGHAGVAEYFDVVRTKTELQYFEYKTTIAEGDMIVVTGREAFRVKSTGKVYDGAFILVFRFRDGKIAHYHAFVDNHAKDQFAAH